MADIAWRFYKLRRKINLRALVANKGIVDYSTFVSYCGSINVAPSTQQEFELEFGPLLKTDSPPVAVEQSPALEATVWLAGVDEEIPVQSTPQKKKKSKDTPKDTLE